MLAFLLGLINPLSKILATIDKRVDDATERERIKAETVQSYVNAQAQVLTGRGYWFPLLFLFPAGLWFSAVCLYSILWCKGCIYPQPWSIAALPTPLNDWLGAMIGSLFIGKAGEAIISKFKR